jgi:hypothetical protein
MSCTQQTWVGAYVLDALEPDEITHVQEHIAGCPVCQDEVVNLSWIPALLRTVQLDEVLRLDDAETPLHSDAPAPAPVLERLLVATRNRNRARRLRRPVAALLAAAAAATLAGASVAQFSGGQGAQSMAIHSVDPHSHVHAAVNLSERSWGTEVQLQLQGVHPGQRCSLIAHARDGRTDVAATWAASYRGTANVPGTTAIPLDQLREFDVVTTDGRRLARLVVADRPMKGTEGTEGEIK